MLKRNIRLIHGQDSQQVLEVQYAEITHFKDNFTLMATVSALLAGFVFMVFGLEAEQIGEYSKLHATSVAYMVAATGSLCANVLVVCLSTLASMLGPGLALRGPEGSVARALEGMRDEHDRVVRLFLFGVYSFFCTVVCLAWFEYEWPVAAPVSALVLGGIVALRRGSRQLARRFALGHGRRAADDALRLLEGVPALLAAGRLAVHEGHALPVLGLVPGARRASALAARRHCERSKHARVVRNRREMTWMWGACQSAHAISY